MLSEACELVSCPPLLSSPGTRRDISKLACVRFDQLASATMVAVSVDQPGQAGREPAAAEKLRTGPDKLINLKKTAEFDRLIEICTAKIRKQPGQEAIRAVLIRASAFTKQGVASESLAAGNRARNELHAHLFAEYCLVGSQCDLSTSALARVLPQYLAHKSSLSNKQCSSSTDAVTS